MNYVIKILQERLDQLSDAMIDLIEIKRSKTWRESSKKRKQLKRAIKILHNEL